MSKRAPGWAVRAIPHVNYFGAPRVVFNNDAELGTGTELSLDEAAAAYAKAMTPEVQTDQTDDTDTDESDTTDDELQDGDEPDSEEDDGETGDEDQAEDGDDEPESEQGRFVADNAKVRLSDGTVTTISELKKGSLLNADYTRKTQELAEQRRSTETQSTEAQASKKQAEDQRQFMTTLLQSIVPQAPDPSLLDTDPMAYMRQKTSHEQWAAHLDKLTQDQQRAAQERQAEVQRKEREKADTEWDALIAKVPEFKDEKRLKAFASKMKDHAAAYGIAPEELRAVALDHRQALILKDAIAWRELQAKKPDVAKKVEGRPPVTRGGKRLNHSERTARTASDAMNRLKETGSERDAVAAYLASQKG